MPFRTILFDFKYGKKGIKKTKMNWFDDKILKTLLKQITPMGEFQVKSYVNYAFMLSFCI